PATVRIEVPTACAVFPKELFYGPRSWLERRYNLRRFTDMPRGGHFAALEELELMVNDLRAFYRDLRTSAGRCRKLHPPVPMRDADARTLPLGQRPPHALRIDPGVGHRIRQCHLGQHGAPCHRRRPA